MAFRVVRVCQDVRASVLVVPRRWHDTTGRVRVSLGTVSLSGDAEAAVDPVPCDSGAG